MPVTTTLNDVLDRLATLVEDADKEGGYHAIRVTAEEARLLITYIESLEDQE